MSPAEARSRTEGRSWHRCTAVLALFGLMGVLIYWPVISRGVWIFDDFDYILEDPAVHAPLLHLLDFLEVRYIGFLTFALNWALGGKDPTGYHVFNVAVHVVNAVLVYWLSVRVLRAEQEGRRGSEEAAALAVPLMAGALFLVHPIQTQAVSYVTQRVASMATLFYLATVLLYVEWRLLAEAEDRPRLRKVLYVLSVAACVLGMKTKEIAITIPVVLVFTDFLLFPGSKAGWSRLAFVVPHFVAASLVPLSLFAHSLGLDQEAAQVYERMRAQKQTDLSTLSPYVYAINQTRVVVQYLRLLLWPTGQRLQYDFDASWSLLDPRVLMSSGLLLALAALGAAFHRSSRSEGTSDARYRLGAAFGIGWFFLTLTVEASVLPIKDLIFEHRVYLPSFGFFFAVPCLAAVALGRCRGRRAVAAMAGLAALLALATLSVATLRRNALWTDEVAMWSDVVEKSPRSFAGFHNRGVALFLRGNYDESLRSLNQAVKLFHESFGTVSAWRDPSISPENAAIVFGFRSRILAMSGHREEARTDFNHVRNLARTLVNPGRLVALMATIAEVFVVSGYPEDAVDIYSEALVHRPLDPGLYVGRAIARGEAGKFSEAIDDLDRAIELAPDEPPAYFNRAYFLQRLGHQEEARADLSTACEQGFETACETLADGWRESPGNGGGAAH